MAQQRDRIEDSAVPIGKILAQRDCYGNPIREYAREEDEQPYSQERALEERFRLK